MCCSALRLEECCCCCTLRTGTIVIAILRLMSAIAAIIYVTTTNAPATDTPWPFIADGVICLLVLLIQSLLLFGVCKKRKCFMVPSLIITFVENILIIIYAIILINWIFVNTNESQTYIIVLCIALLYNALCWYCWLCVWSYYMKLSDLDEQEAPEIHYTPRNVIPGYLL